MKLAVRQATGQRTKQIVVVLAFAAVAVSLWLAYVFLPGPMARNVVKGAIETYAEEWKEILFENLSDPVEAIVTGDMTGSDMTFMTNYLMTSDFFGVTFIRPDGTATWSSFPENIGLMLGSPRFLTALAKGAPVTFLNDESREQDAPQLLAPGSRFKTADIYLPVLDTGQIIGVLRFSTEVTEEYTRYKAIFKRDISRLAMVVAGLLSVLALFLLNRMHKSQLREAEGRAAEERERIQLQLTLTREVRLLGELNAWLQSSRSLDELFGMVAKFMSHFLTASSGSLYVYSNSRDVLDGAVSWSGGCHQNHIHPEDCWGLRRGRTYTYGTGEVDFSCAHVDATTGRPYTCMPILAHGETVGLMTLTARDNASIEIFEAERRMAQVSAEQISLAIANVRMRDALQHQAIRDPLTGLFNRRYLMDTLRRLKDVRSASVYGVISIDIDHFKTFNDNHGHDAGDIVLRAVGEVLAGACEGEMIACRTGGEELMLLLPDTTLALAMAKAEEIRNAVAGLAVPYGDTTLPRVSVSVGVALSPEHGRAPQDVIRAADEALYQAKAAGRNQVMIARQAQPGMPPGTSGQELTTPGSTSRDIGSRADDRINDRSAWNAALHGDALDIQPDPGSADLPLAV